MRAEHSVAAAPGDQESDTRQNRQAARQRAISEAVMTSGTVRIDELADRFGISVMTAHRDIDELARRGLLRKSRGVVSAASTSLIESSDVYRVGREHAEKQAIARAALALVEPGQAIMLDDSTTVLELARLLPRISPLTVISNALTVINELRHVPGIGLLGLGGQYYNWCSAFMGPMTTHAISQMHADLFVMSTAAISNDVIYHQSLQTVEVKRAMYEASGRRILLADHTKFEKVALHALLPLSSFDTVIVDRKTPRSDIRRLRDQRIDVVVADGT